MPYLIVSLKSYHNYGVCKLPIECVLTSSKMDELFIVLQERQKVVNTQILINNKNYYSYREKT